MQECHIIKCQKGLFINVVYGSVDSRCLNQNSELTDFADIVFLFACDDNNED